MLGILKKKEFCKNKLGGEFGGDIGGKKLGALFEAGDQDPYPVPACTLPPPNTKLAWNFGGVSPIGPGLPPPTAGMAGGGGGGETSTL